MSTKRSNNSKRIKSFGLAACAVMALGVMAPGEAAAQCRTSGNAGYGYNTGYRGFSNTTGQRGLGNGYNYRSNFDNRFQSGYGYNVPQRFNGYSREPSSQSPRLSYDRNLNARYDRNLNARYDSGFNRFGTGLYGNRSRYGNTGNGFYNTSREPVIYRHGNHTDVESDNGRLHLRRSSR